MRILYSDGGLAVAADGVALPSGDGCKKLADAFGEEYAHSLEKRYPAAAAESLSGALLLLELLERLGAGAGKIERGEHGKPAFADGHVFFSISHDRAAVVCAVSGRPAGIDVMMLPQKSDPSVRLRMARRFFTSKEADAVGRGEASRDGGEEFARCWTAREAYSKLLGGTLGPVLGRRIPSGPAFMRFSPYVAGSLCHVCCCTAEKGEF